MFHSRSNSIVPSPKQVFIHTLKVEIGLEELKLLNESLCVDPWGIYCQFVLLPVLHQDRCFPVAYTLWVYMVCRYTLIHPQTSIILWILSFLLEVQAFWWKRNALHCECLWVAAKLRVCVCAWMSQTKPLNSQAQVYYSELQPVWAGCKLW